MRFKVQKTTFVAIFAILMTPTFAKSENTNNGEQTLGFECAQEYTTIIPMLGRGEDFPAFLARDIGKELKRQNNKSKLVSITCEGEPILKASHITIEENGLQQKVLSQLSFTIPVKVIVKNGRREMTLLVDQNYNVENLDKPGHQRTTQNFIVKQ